MEYKKILGVDYGDMRTGLALSDLTATLASAAGCIKCNNFKKTAEQVSDFAKSHGVSLIVLGHPVNMDGTLGFRSEKIKDFAKEVEGISGIKVVLEDERLSTANAHTILNITDTRGAKRKRVIDEVSACLILQSYLDRTKEKNG